MIFRFASPWLLTLIPLALAVSWRLARRRRRGDARALLPGAGLRLRIGTSPWQRLEGLVPWIRCAILVAIVFALARPQAGTRIETVTTYGVDIVLVLDVSTSMKAEDFPGNRLEEARRTVERFVAGRPADRIGLVVFAGVAVTRCPLTLDHEMLRQFLVDVDFAERDQDGTALGMGLATAVNRLRRSDAKSRVVVLLTDGSNNRGQIAPETAAEAARALGIRVYSVGVGTEGTALTPVPTTFGIRKVPQPVDLDEELLRMIADRTHGRYFRATDARSLADIFSTIDALEPTKIESRVRMLHTELFPYALIPGFVLLGLERLLLGTRLRRIP